MEAVAKVLEALLKIAKQYGIASVIAMLAISANLYLVNNTIQQAQAHEEADRAQRTRDAETIAKAIAELSQSVKMLNHDTALSQDAMHDSLLELSMQIRVLQTVSGTMKRTVASQAEMVRTMESATEIIANQPAPPRM